MAISPNDEILAKDIEDELGKKIDVDSIVSAETIINNGEPALSGKLADAVFARRLHFNRLYASTLGNAWGQFTSIGNIGASSKTIAVKLSSGDQFIFIFGSSTADTCYMQMIGGGPIAGYSVATHRLSVTVNSDTLTITLPAYFRGCVFSYASFTVSRI